MAGESFAAILFMISDISFGAAAVSLILAVILFFRFRIPSVIDDLSGRNIRRSVRQLRDEHEIKGNKNFYQAAADEGYKTNRMDDDATVVLRDEHI